MTFEELVYNNTIATGTQLEVNVNYKFTISATLHDNRSLGALEQYTNIGNLQIETMYALEKDKIYILLRRTKEDLKRENMLVNKFLEQETGGTVVISEEVK